MLILDEGLRVMKPDPSSPSGRRKRLFSKVVGVYQTLLRRGLEHFFPDAVLESVSGRSVIDWANSQNRSIFHMNDDPDGLGLRIEFFRTQYRLLPGNPSPFLDSERKLVATILRVMEIRYRAMYDPAAALQYELFHHPLEDLIVAESIAPGETNRIPSALEALRVSSLSTYENRRVSTGVLLLGTTYDPTSPRLAKPPDAPRYGVELSAIKSFHRLCDGLRTVFVVDHEGDLTHTVDLDRWADQVRGSREKSPDFTCPRPYQSHARATRADGHVCLVLSPYQEIKVLAGGTMTFAFSDARWRLLDIPSKFEVWCRAVGASRLKDLAARLFHSALNLSEDRRGALFVVLRDPERSVSRLVDPTDQIDNVNDHPNDDEHPPHRLAKRAMHHLARGRGIGDLEPTVLESLAGIDGAVVTDLQGRLHAFGAILRIPPENLVSHRAVEGSRTAAALAASFHGPVLKVSEDGFLTMFLGGRRIWEI